MVKYVLHRMILYSFGIYSWHASLSMRLKVGVETLFGVVTYTRGNCPLWLGSIVVKT